MKYRQQQSRDRECRQRREHDAGYVVPVSPARRRKQVPVDMIIPFLQHHHGGNKAEHRRGQGGKENIEQTVVRGQRCACTANQDFLRRGNAAAQGDAREQRSRPRRKQHPVPTNQPQHLQKAPPHSAHRRTPPSPVHMFKTQLRAAAYSSPMRAVVRTSPAAEHPLPAMKSMQTLAG